MPFMALLDLEQLICGDYNYYINNMASKQQQNSRTLKPETPTKATKFADLNVGPLLKNQLVRQIMRIPDDVTSIRQLKPITGVDLCRHLVNYLRENELWSKKVKESEFEVYLLEKTKVKNAWMLGYRIANVGNLIGALKSIQHLYAESMREIRTQLGDEMKVTFENEKRWIVKQLNDRFTSVKDPSAQTSLKFLEADSIDFIDGFIGLFKKMLNPEEFKFVDDFLLVLKESVYLRDCFQLAICLGKRFIL
jgi:acyl carrier protein